MTRFGDRRQLRPYSLILLRKERELIVPHPAIKQAAMQKDNRGAPTGALIGQPHSRIARTKAMPTSSTPHHAGCPSSSAASAFGMRTLSAELAGQPRLRRVLLDNPIDPGT